jgi:hypothetical protein
MRGIVRGEADAADRIDTARAAAASTPLAAAVFMSRKPSGMCMTNHSDTSRKKQGNRSPTSEELASHWLLPPDFIILKSNIREFGFVEHT